MIYCACFHSVVNCRLMCLENSSHSANIFKIQKNIIRILYRMQKLGTCVGDLCKGLKILPLHSQYVLSPLFCG